MRFFAPLFLLGTAAWVAWVNSGTQRQIVFPFLERLAQDTRTQGHLTVGLLLTLGAGALLLAMRQRATPPEQ